MTTSTLHNKAVEHRVINKLFRRLIVFLFILFVFSFLDRINIGFAGLTMGKDLGLTSTMFGLAATLFYVTYVLCGIPSNIMLAKVGARRWIAGIMVVWGIASTCTMFATSPETLYVLRMLVGIAEAGFLPGILVYLTWWFPAYHRARANALFMIAMPVTMMLGSILSGYILAMDGLWNLKGWQWLFLRGADARRAALHAGLLLPDEYAERDQHLDAADPAKLQHRQQQYRDWPAGGDPAVLHHPRDDLVEPPLRQAERAKKAHHPAVSVCSGGMDAGLGDRSQPDPAAWHHHGLNRIVYRHGDILDHAGSGY